MFPGTAHFKSIALSLVTSQLFLVNTSIFLEQYTCIQCGRSYNRKSNLKRHLRVECGRDPLVKCHICNANFKYFHVLRRHLNFVHGLQSKDVEENMVANILGRRSDDGEFISYQ